MATKRAFSVAKTEKGYGNAVDYSAVYSLSGVPGVDPKHDGMGSESYGHATLAGGLEGRRPALVIGGDPGGTAETGIATAVVLTNNGDTMLEYASTTQVCHTTTLTGDGAGLIVRVDFDASGDMALNATPVVAGGSRYDAGDTDTVSVDGLPNSVLTVTVA